MRTFVADTGYWDGGNVWICEDGKQRILLDPRFDVLNKSPTGFAWGYEGSGPAQLSFALLAAVIGIARAQQPELFQAFKREVIAPLLQREGWQLSEQFIRDWIEKHTGGSNE